MLLVAATVSVPLHAIQYMLWLLEHAHDAEKLYTAVLFGLPNEHRALAYTGLAAAKVESPGRRVIQLCYSSSAS